MLFFGSIYFAVIILPAVDLDWLIYSKLVMPIDTSQATVMRYYRRKPITI